MKEQVKNVIKTAMHFGVILTNEAAEALIKAALYSDHPSPEMVCETCGGTGKLGWPYPANGKGQETCIDCNGTGKVPSPEPPEKVSLNDEEKKDIEDILINNKSYSFRRDEADFDTDNALKELVTMTELIIEKHTQAQILKLQQAGWGEISGKDAEIAELERVLDNWRKLATERYDKNREQEARIKEMEGLIPTCGNCITPEQLAEARQQARKEIIDWLESGQVIWLKYPGMDKEWKKQKKVWGELPKE